MNFNKTKKILLVLMLGIVAFLINGVSVKAYEFANSALGSYKGNYCDYEISTGDSDKSAAIYDTKHIYLIYDGKNIRWLGSGGDVKSCGSPWDNNGILKLRVNCNDKDLKNALVENNQLVRCSELYYSVDSGITGAAPDLKITTSSSMDTRGSSSGILMNTTGDTIDDTYTVGKCAIAGKECMTGEGKSTPSNSVTNIIIEKKHSDKDNKDTITATANGYSINLSSSAKSFINKATIAGNGEIDCSGLTTLCKGTSCQIDTKEFTCDYEPTTDPTCTDAEDKLAVLKQALADFRAAVGAAQSAMNFADAYNITTSYQRFQSAKDAALRKNQEFESAFNEYKALYDKKYKSCPNLEDYTSINQQAQSLFKALNSFSLDAVNRCDKLKDSSISESERQQLESVCNNLNNDSQQINEQFQHYLAEHGNVNIDDGAVFSCEGLLGTNVLNDISRVLSWIKIGVPILLILLGSLDFGKAVLADDPKTLNKATNTFIKRCIAAVAVFFAPFVIMYILKFVDGLAGGCDIEDLLKGVIMWKI